MSDSKESEVAPYGAGISIGEGIGDLPKTLSKSESDLDDNYALYQQQAGEPLDVAEAKRVLRKVDWRVMPILFVVYLLQYLDKNGINYASAYGLEDGTGLEGQVRSYICLCRSHYVRTDHIVNCRTTHGFQASSTLATCGHSTRLDISCSD